MALIVEDGTAKTDAESYATVAQVDTYQSNRGVTLWATLSTNEKEQALRRATTYMTGVYRLKWKGTRVNSTQALDWPRNWVEYEDYAFVTQNGAQTIGGFFYYPANEVPVEVVNACCELAFKAAFGDLQPDIGRRTVREKVDVIEVEYDRFSPQYVMYRSIDNMLSPLLGGSVGGAFRSVIRT